MTHNVYRERSPDGKYPIVLDVLELESPNYSLSFFLKGLKVPVKRHIVSGNVNGIWSLVRVFM